MNWILLFLFCSTTLTLNAFQDWEELRCLQNTWGQEGEKIVLKTKKITLSEYPEAYNPSLVKYKDGYLLLFRYSPDLDQEFWLSYIGVVMLNSDFEILSKPQILEARFGNSSSPPQSEDARAFIYRDKIYVIYNDSLEGISLLDTEQRRDMYLSELIEDNGYFTLTTPLKLIHKDNYKKQKIEKNWTPFIVDDSLLLSYSLDPHEILYPNLKTGMCFPISQSSTYVGWKLGTMRSGIPAQEINGELFSFFHSPIIMTSPLSEGYNLWHFFMGAYTFSKDPPFELTKISQRPLVGKQFYSQSNRWKIVLYPGSFVIQDNLIYLPYGKNDVEIWIATLDLKALFNSMIPIAPLSDSIFESLEYPS